MKKLTIMFLFPRRLAIFAGLKNKSWMFTFGIFSTHLPYIAFVLFYGFFFLVGIEKASAGEMGEGEKIIPHEISVSVDFYADVDDDNLNNNNAYHGNICFEQMLLYGDKIKLFYYFNRFIKTTDCRYPWFSRPPPDAIEV